LREFREIALACLLISLAIALTFSLQAFSFLALALASGWVYSAKPLRLKRLGAFNNAVIGLISFVVVLFGFAVFSGKISFFPPEIALLVFAAISFGANVKDLKDRETDARNGIKTLPVFFGERKSRTLVGFLVFLSFLFAGIILWDFLLFGIGFVFGAMGFIALKKFSASETAIFFLYYFFFGIFSFFVL